MACVRALIPGRGQGKTSRSTSLYLHNSQQEISDDLPAPRIPRQRASEPAALRSTNAGGIARSSTSAAWTNIAVDEEDDFSTTEAWMESEGLGELVMESWIPRRPGRLVWWQRALRACLGCRFSEPKPKMEHYRVFMAPLEGRVE